MKLPSSQTVPARILPGAGLTKDLVRPDPDVFEAFIAHYLPRVLAYSRDRADDPREAERLTEAIFEEAVRLCLGDEPPERIHDAVFLAIHRVVAPGH